MVTVAEAGRLAAASRPRGVLRGSRAILLGASMLLGALLADPAVFGLKPPFTWLIPQALLLALVGVILAGLVHHRRLARLMLEAFEAVQLQQHERALPLLRRLLSRPLRHTQARAELLLALSSVAEHECSYDAAQRLYETLIEEGTGDALQLHTARLALAAAMLRTGQLADAVGLIDRLSRADLPAPLKAQVELVSLFREVVMGQAQDNLAAAEGRRRLFRDHLSTRAGYGYGLLAAAFDRAEQIQQARRFWHDATLLVRPGELVRRFQDLEPLASKYPAAEVAL